MPRPREFDLDEALDAAMGAFWRRGYEGTSLADLMHAMGLQKGSIYKAFGDKHALFLCALQRYLDTMHETQRDTLAGARSPRAALQAWLDRLIEAAPVEGGGCRGCLAVNTLVELGPHDEQARAILEAHFEQVRQLLIAQIREGQERREIRADIDAGHCAQFLMTMAAGLLGSLKGATSKPEARRLAQTTLQLLT